MIKYMKLVSISSTLFYKKFTSISSKMAPCEWGAGAHEGKLEEHCQQVAALFKTHTTGAYGTKKAKSVGCPP